MHSLNLTRRPLKTLGESIREPNAAGSLYNRIRRRFIEPYKPSNRNKTRKNRIERDNYKKRMPRRQDGRQNNPHRPQGGKRRAVDKRLGGRVRGPQGGFSRR